MPFIIAFFHLGECPDWDISRRPPNKFAYKSSPIVWQIFEFVKSVPLKVNLLLIRLGNFLGKFELLMIPTSGHTGLGTIRHSVTLPFPLFLVLFHTTFHSVSPTAHCFSFFLSLPLHIVSLSFSLTHFFLSFSLPYKQMDSIKLSVGRTVAHTNFHSLTLAAHYLLSHLLSSSLARSSFLCLVQSRRQRRQRRRQQRRRRRRRRRCAVYVHLAERYYDHDDDLLLLHICQ